MPIKWIDEQPKQRRIRWADEEPVITPDQINARVAQAHDVANDPNLALGEDLYDRGFFFGGRNKLTGEMEGNVLGAIPKAIIEAAKLPGDVYTGKTSFRGPDGNINPDVIRRSFDLAALFSPAANFVNPVVKAAKPLAQVARKNVDDAAEFGIDLSRGQATGRFKDQAFEQDALTSGRGPGAQRVFDTQRKLQKEQIEQAAGNITDRVSPSRVDNAFQAAENVSGALQQKASGLRNQSDDLYRAAEGANAELAPDSIKTLSANLRSTLDDVGAMEGTIVAAEYPTAARALQRVETMLSKAPEGDLVGVGWQNVERVRRMLLNKGSGPDETRVLGQMRKSFDNWMENSVHDALVSGNPKFLDDLKNARRLYRQYKQIIGNDSAIIRKMADGSANSEQVANWLYGASKVGGKGDSSNTLREIKSLIGADHPAIADLKRGVTMRLFQDKEGEVKTAGKLAADILEFTNNKGHELAKELYGPENLRELKRFAAVLKQTIPDPNATNPSRSGHTVTRQVWDGLLNLAPVLGLAANSFSGMLAGFGIKVGVNEAARRTAKSMVSKPVPAQLPKVPRQGILPTVRGTILGLENDQLPQLAPPLPKITR